MEFEEKVTISRKKIENVKCEYEGTEFILYPYIDFEIEASLIMGYLAQYFYPSIDENNPKWNDVITSLTKKNIWYAEYFLKQTILQELTNVDVNSLSTEDTLDLFEVVSSKIINIYNFKERLFDMVNDVEKELESRKSLGVVIDKTVNKLTEIFESLQSIDPEALKELADSLIKKVEDSPVSEIFTEASKQNQITKQTKTRKVKESK